MNQSRHADAGQQLMDNTASIVQEILKQVQDDENRRITDEPEPSC